MPTRRFPKTKYIRQLRALEADMREWAASYRQAEAEHPDDWLGSRFAERADVLDEIAYAAMKLGDLIYAVPRIS